MRAGNIRIAVWQQIEQIPELVTLPNADLHLQLCYFAFPTALFHSCPSIEELNLYWKVRNSGSLTVSPTNTFWRDDFPRHSFPAGGTQDFLSRNLLRYSFVGNFGKIFNLKLCQVSFGNFGAFAKIVSKNPLHNRDLCHSTLEKVSRANSAVPA